MANAVYPLWKTSIMTEADTLNGLDVNTATNGPYVALLTASYTYSAAHQFYSSLTGIVGTDQNITSPSVSATAGVFSGSNVTFSAVTTGSTVAEFVIYRHNSGANTTWRLVLYEDTGVTGLPVVTNGGDISISWNVSGILAL